MQLSPTVVKTLRHLWECVFLCLFIDLFHFSILFVVLASNLFIIALHTRPRPMPFWQWVPVLKEIHDPAKTKNYKNLEHCARSIFRNPGESGASDGSGCNSKEEIWHKSLATLSESLTQKAFINEWRRSSSNWCENEPEQADGLPPAVQIIMTAKPRPPIDRIAKKTMHGWRYSMVSSLFEK